MAQLGQVSIVIKSPELVSQRTANLYAILDLLSRCLAADCESDELAESLISTLRPRTDSPWRAESRIDMGFVQRDRQALYIKRTPYVDAQFKTRK